MSLLGIDIGTSGCKAAIFAEDGTMLALAYEEYDTRHPKPGWAELDSLQVWEQVRRTIRKAAAGCSGESIRALSVSSLGEAMVPVTAGRRILGPSLLNFDLRGAEYVAGLTKALPAEKWYQVNGNLPGNQYSLTKLMWLRDNQPEIFRQADFFLHWSGFVAFMLGADPWVDYSLANRTLLFDILRCDWSEELLELAQLERQKLPPTAPSGKIIGTVARSVAEELGLPAGIPIVSGGHDQCCNGVGSGVIREGQALYGMGTYLCMMPVFASRPPDALMMERGLNTEHHAVPGLYACFIYNQGGALVKWYRDTFARLDRKEALARQADIYHLLLSEMPAGPSRVMVLPHFTATGPPDFIADSCGVITGLTLETSRGEILKGLIEATTFYLRECFDSLPATGITVTDFRAVGGGSKSDAWVQVCADILGQPFLRPKTREAGALGAAILAGAGSGVFSSMQAGVKAMVQPERTFLPDPAKYDQYQERYQHYRRLWPLMGDYLRTQPGAKHT
jgi:xylulokinase